MRISLSYGYWIEFPPFASLESTSCVCLYARSGRDIFTMDFLYAFGIWETILELPADVHKLKYLFSLYESLEDHPEFCSDARYMLAVATIGIEKNYCSGAQDCTRWMGWV